MYQLPTSDFFFNILHQPQSILPTHTNNFLNQNLTTNSPAPVLLQRAARSFTDTMPPNQMTKGDASRIQAGQVKFSAPFMESVYWTDQLTSKAKAGGNMSSNGFSARAQSAGDRNSNVNVGTTKSSSGFGNAGIGGGQSGAGSGGGSVGAK
jgi:uncharacterized membrane protein YgcG